MISWNRNWLPWIPSGQRKKRQLDYLRSLQYSDSETNNRALNGSVTSNSSQDQKIKLFRSLFKGREDVYPRRFESKRTGKSGYQPVCRNEWIRPYCKKPKIKCAECENRDFEPVSDEVIRRHLMLSKMYKRRLSGYRSIGYEIIQG